MGQSQCLPVASVNPPAHTSSHSRFPSYIFLHSPASSRALQGAPGISEFFPVLPAQATPAGLPSSLPSFFLRKNHKAAKDPYSFAQFHFCPAVRVENIKRRRDWAFSLMQSFFHSPPCPQSRILSAHTLRIRLDEHLYVLPSVGSRVLQETLEGRKRSAFCPTRPETGSVRH